MTGARAGSGIGAAATAAGDASATAAPHPVQKRVLAVSLLPQPVQKAVDDGAAVAGMGLPHTVQNLEEPLTSFPHDEQTAMTDSCWIFCFSQRAKAPSIGSSRTA